MRMKKLASAALGVVGLLGLALTTASAQTPLKIGIIAPLTGPGAPWGLALKTAAEIVAAEVNAKGGLDVGGKKYQIGVIAYDDEYKAATAIAAYTRLINQDGAKYIAVLSSAPAMALKEHIENDKIFSLTGAFAPQAIDDKTKYLFRIYGITGDYLPLYGDWLAKNLTERRITTLNPNDETGWGHSKVTDEIFKQKGFNVVSNELYERSLKDFQPLLTKVVGQKPEIIDLGTSAPPTAGLIVRQARELGYKGKFLQTGGAGWSAIVDAAGKEAAEGLINMLYADPNNPGYQKVVAEYRKVINQEPTDIIAPWVDAFNITFKAIQKGGDVNDTTKTANAFKSVLPYTTLHGDEAVYKHQQISSYNYVSVLKDGKPVVVGKMR